MKNMSLTLRLVIWQAEKEKGGFLGRKSRMYKYMFKYNLKIEETPLGPFDESTGK